MAKAPKSKQPRTNTNTNTKKGTALAKRVNKAEVIDPKEIEEKLNKLEKCEKIIHDKTDSFIEVIAQLAIIKKDKLYEGKVDSKGKPLFKTFEAYIDSEFGFKRAYYSRLNAAYATYKQIEEKQPDEIKLLPKYPEFYTALSEIKEEKRLDVIEEFKKKKAETSKKMRGSDIRKWGSENKVLVKKKSSMPHGIIKKIEIFKGIANSLAEVESIADDIKKLKDYDDTTKATLKANLQKIINNLK